MRPLEVQKKVEDDPEFEVKKAQKKLRRYVAGHAHAIRQKAEQAKALGFDEVIDPASNRHELKTLRCFLQVR